MIGMLTVKAAAIYFYKSNRHGCLRNVIVSLLKTRQELHFLYAVSVTWNGNTISQSHPVLIYHHEVRVIFNGQNFIPHETVPTLGDAGSRALVCRSETRHRVAWYLTDGVIVNSTGSPDFFQHRTLAEETPSITRLLRYGNNSVPSASHNGLWTCRLNGDSSGSIPVGLYQRGGGEKL